MTGVDVRVLGPAEPSHGPLHPSAAVPPPPSCCRCRAAGPAVPTAELTARPGGTAAAVAVAVAAAAAAVMAT